jgi:hypothetical protein
MDEQSLIARLTELQPPGLEEARTRGQLAARVRFGNRPPARPRAARVRRAALVGAVACAAIVLAGVVTQPGQGVASWVGERLGIGQPGGPPGLQDLREFALAPSGEADVPAYVIARGPVAVTGGHYEVVTRVSRVERKRCYELQIVDPASLYGPSCITDPGPEGLVVDQLGANLAPEFEFQSVQGRVGEDVASVRVEFDGREIPVQVTDPDPELLEGLRIEPPVRFYFAAFDGFIAGGELSVEALDSDGQVLSTQTRHLFDQRQMLRLP